MQRLQISPEKQTFIKSRKYVIFSNNAVVHLMWLTINLAT